jgi:phospholipid-translocating ATPase
LEKTAAISEPMFSAQNRYPELKTERLLQYVRERPNTTFARKTRHFLMCMALCNTCLPEIKENGEIEYQASSPDELALVEAARDLGYEMIDRPAQFIKLRFPDENGRPVVETFEVLDVIEFTSKRKRMSIIIRMPDNSICVFCKGADSALLPRLKLSHLAMQKQRQIERQASKRRSQEQETVIRRRSLVGTPRTSLTLGRTLSGHAPRRTETVRSDDFDFDIQPRMSSAGDKDSYSPVSPRASAAFSQDNLDAFIDDSVAVNEGTVFERCFQHTDDFATDGLRTLLFASRYLEEDEYRRWKKIYHEATTSLNERQSRIEAAGELIETKFDLAGATAIEDKLQDGVPDTIDKLRRANIKVWMLTGDKRETAINIGHSAKVCKPYSEIYVLDSEADESLMDKLTVTLNEVARGMVPHSVVVIDGGTLACVDADENLSTVFYELVVRVDSVICCRASPSQKAHLVKKIRHGVPQSMTLAIGDGANDISMILAAQVGIGISGREGLQAARSADFSIAQFRFLQRLLFVHGRWNYMRTGKYILATFWKEIFFFTVQAHYQPWNGYTGTSLYENWSLTVFNGVFTSIPVWILGILDRDLKASTLLKFPELYRFGQQEKGFNFRMYLGWSFIGAIEAAIMFYAVWAVYRELPFDQDTSLYAMGSVNFTVSVIFINAKLL